MKANFALSTAPEKNMCNRNLCRITEGRFLPQKGGAAFASAAVGALDDHVFVWRKKRLFPSAWKKNPSNNLLERRPMQRKTKRSIFASKADLIDFNLVAFYE